MKKHLQATMSATYLFFILGCENQNEGKPLPETIPEPMWLESPLEGSTGLTPEELNLQLVISTKYIPKDENGRGSIDQLKNFITINSDLKNNLDYDLVTYSEPNISNGLRMDLTLKDKPIGAKRIEVIIKSISTSANRVYDIHLDGQSAPKIHTIYQKERGFDIFFTEPVELDESAISYKINNSTIDVQVMTYSRPDRKRYNSSFFVAPDANNIYPAQIAIDLSKVKSSSGEPVLFDENRNFLYDTEVQNIVTYSKEANIVTLNINSPKPLMGGYRSILGISDL